MRVKYDNLKTMLENDLSLAVESVEAGIEEEEAVFDDFEGENENVRDEIIAEDNGEGNIFDLFDL